MNRNTALNINRTHALITGGVRYFAYSMFMFKHAKGLRSGTF